MSKSCSFIYRLKSSLKDAPSVKTATLSLIIGHLFGLLSATKQEYVMSQGRIDALKGIRTILKNFFSRFLEFSGSNIDEKVIFDQIMPIFCRIT